MALENSDSHGLAEKKLSFKNKVQFLTIEQHTEQFTVKSVSSLYVDSSLTKINWQPLLETWKGWQRPTIHQRTIKH